MTWELTQSRPPRRSSLFQLFNVRLSRGGKIDHCRGMCKNNTICSLRSLRSENNCAVVRPGFSFQDKERFDPETPVTEPIKHETDPADGEGEGEEGGGGGGGEDGVYMTAQSLYDRQHDHFGCEGPGLASVIREMVDRGVRARDRNKGRKKEGVTVAGMLSAMGASSAEEASDVNPLLLLKQEAERVVKEHRGNRKGSWWRR